MKNTKKTKQNHLTGFTLIELLVVVAIISLLSSIVLAALSTSRSMGRDAKRQLEAKQVENAAALFASDYQGYVPYNGLSQTYYIQSLLLPATSVGCNQSHHDFAMNKLQSALASDNALNTELVDPTNNSGYCYFYVSGPKVATINGVDVSDAGSFCFISENKTVGGYNARTCVGIGYPNEVYNGSFNSINYTSGFPGSPDIVLGTGYSSY